MTLGNIILGGKMEKCRVELWWCNVRVEQLLTDLNKGVALDVSIRYWWSLFE